MPIYAANMKHSPESCPLFNKEILEKFKEKISKRDEVAKKYDIKILSAVTSVLEHLIFFVIESSSQSKVEDYFKDTGMAFWNNIEIRQVKFVEDVLKRL